MMKMAKLGYLFALLCSFAALLPGMQFPVVDAACATSRVRKNYDTMTVAERQLYRNALQLSMDKGYYIKFVEMHTEKMSEMEAHRMCMFTYWHRYFLLGFENMLRSLGPEYECITVPYWDQMQQNARSMTGACTSLQSCAMIVRDMGGSTIGTDRGVMINGAWVSGDRCVSSAPLNHFCEASSKTGAACARCVPRNNLLTRQFPPSTNFASVYRQLFMSGSFVSTGKSIEEGMHNAIHAEMGGAMGTFQSPSDPLFWSHHAYVDLLLTVYLKCRVGLNKLTDAQKMNNQYAFVQCPHREDAGFFTSASTVTMRSGQLGADPKQVNVPGQNLYPFFAGLPNKYYQLSDVTQLGANRYTYQAGGLVGQMAIRCDAATGPTRRRLRQSGSKHFDCKSDLDEDSLIKNQDGNSPSTPSGQNGNTTLTNNDDHQGGTITDSPNHQENAATSVPNHQGGSIDPVPDLPRDLPIDNTDDNDPDAAKVTAWVDDVHHELAEALKRDPYQQKTVDQATVADQLEKMVCLFYDQCRGGVTDYSEEFKIAFKVNEPPPCKRLVDELEAETTDPIRLPEWKLLMEKYFPCATTTASPYAPRTELVEVVPTPTPTPTLTSTSTSTPTPTEMEMETPTPTQSVTSEPTPTSTPMETLPPTSTETPTETPTPTSTETPMPTEPTEPTGTPAATTPTPTENP